MLNKNKSLKLFEYYLKYSEVTSLDNKLTENSKLYGKRLGIINGSSWSALWGYYFGRKYLPGVKLVSVGNEAIQLNFMEAYARKEKCPPDSNIRCFERYAVDLCELGKVDAILITCSTMNRSHQAVQDAVAGYDVPVVSIDEPMMEQAVQLGRRILVVATHGPTINSTSCLLQEVSRKFNRDQDIQCFGENIEQAFHCLEKGDVRKHNKAIEDAIRKNIKQHHIDCVVLAQISMGVFKIEHPKCEKEFGIPVLTSGEEGFKYVKNLLESLNT